MALARGLDEPSTWGNRGSESPLNQWLFPDRMEIRAHDWMPSPSIEWRTAMEEYIGLDVSMKETAVSIRRAGERIWRGKCASDPRIIAELIRKRAPAVKRVESDPRRHENLRSARFLPEREAPSRRTSVAFLPIRTDLHRSCFRCWKPGVAFASAPPNSDASWSGTRARVRLAASLCLFPASVRSPQPPSPQPLRGRTTSRNPDLLAPGSA